MYLSTPSHAPGTVDVVVSGRGGQSVTLTGAYTYVSPVTFDFNGDWVSYGQTDEDGLVSFTIRDNLLLSVSCGPDVTLTFSPPRPVTNGEFSFVRDDGVGFSGRIVAVSSAYRNDPTGIMCIQRVARQGAMRRVAIRQRDDDIAEAR